MYIEWCVKTGLRYQFLDDRMKLKNWMLFVFYTILKILVQSQKISHFSELSDQPVWH